MTDEPSYTITSPIRKYINIWDVLDELGHRLHLPRWVRYRLCNRFDRSLDVE